ncbi:MAG: recombinase family protein [Anaeroplasmataceae bacterium]|nr:recombinase family protein [Anaeroplasmataceae bacterium]
MSRLGRNYLQTGYYIEEYFPQKKVRYIAINDSFDTESSVEDDFAPFKNIINEWYAKDISKKIKSTFLVKRENGEMVSGFPLYGYKYINGITKRVISEEEANVVRLIFDLYINGKSCLEISRYLSEHKIYTPRYSFYKKYNWFKNYFSDRLETYKYKWNPEFVRNIIKNEEYTGKVILNKKEKKSYKSKIKTKTPESMLIVGTSPAIISLETYTKANQIFQRNKSLKQPLKNDFLRGLLFCPFCKKRMSFCKKIIKNRDGTIKKQEYMAYICRKSGCHQRAIKQSSINEIIIQELNVIRDIILKNQGKFLTLIENKDFEMNALDHTIHKINLAKLKSLEQDSKSMDQKIECLISGRADGTIPISTYHSLLNKYSLEKENIDDQIQNLKRRVQSETMNCKIDSSNYYKKILDIFKKYDGQSLLEKNHCGKFILKIYPYVEKKYFSEEKVTRNYIKQIQIDYININTFIKESL